MNPYIERTKVLSSLYLHIGLQFILWCAKNKDCIISKTKCTQSRKFSRSHLYLCILLWLASSAHALTVSISLNQSASLDCSIVTELPAMNKETCHEYVVGRQSAHSGPGKIKVTVCPVETAHPDDKEYFIYSSSSNLPWLCRNEKEEEWETESTQQAAPPILSITIGDEQTDVPDDQIPAVFGGGYGSDYYDDSPPGKPGMPGGILPFLLGTVSAGLLPASVIPFAFDLELPELSGSAPIIFEQGVMSDNSEILIITSGFQLKIYQRTSLFSHWQLMGQTHVNAISSVQWNSGDDFIAEDKLARALAGAFGWGYDKYNRCEQVPGLRVCPKTGTKTTPTHQRQDQSTSEASSTPSLSAEGPGKAKKRQSSNQSPDDRKRKQSRQQHHHVGPSCPHPDCCPHRCRCTECQSKSKRSIGLPVEQAISVQQALKAVGEFNGQYKMLGFLLGAPYDFINEIYTSYEPMLTLAHNFNLLTAKRLVMAMSFTHGEAPARQAARHLNISYSDAVPDCYLENAKPDLEDAISPRDAFLLVPNLLETSALAVEMGLPNHVRKTIEAVGDVRERQHTLLWQLQQHGLLTYGRFLSTVKHLHYDVASKASQQLGLELMPRQPDYQVFPGDRFTALSQPLSLRDLVDIIPSYISHPAIAQGLGCPDIAQSVSLHGTSRKDLIDLLTRCMTQKKGLITANEVVTMFYHPELMRWKDARELVEALTGRPADRTIVSKKNAARMQTRIGFVENIKGFGLKLGLPPRLMTFILQEHDDYSRQLRAVFSRAIDLDRLTPENLVYALDQTGNSHRVARVAQLAGITGQRLPDEAPVYLSEEESGQMSEPLERANSGSVTLTFANCSGLPLSHNWYWIGLAMGLSFSELDIIETDTHRDPVKSLYRMLTTLANRRGYETGHLYKVLEFLGDQEAIEAFPAHLKGTPTRALATVAPLSSMAHALIAVARELQEDPEVFGQQLELPDHHIALILDDHRKDPRRIIVELIHKTTQQVVMSRSELLERLVNVAYSLHRPDMKISLPEAMDWSEQEAHQQQVQGVSVLVSDEHKLRQLLRKAALASLRVPPEFICSITLDIVQEPVTIKMGEEEHLFERAALKKWIEKHGRNPLTNLPLDWDQVKESPETRQKILQWLEASPLDSTQR